MVKDKEAIRQEISRKVQEIQNSSVTFVHVADVHEIITLYQQLNPEPIQN
ncbi:hypothetical protein QUF84_20130 [Fictibacillus enclensis]|nr:hypothetical protein [Fictibacillus enclensis]MDM5339511.1 hypothetical protein [Fictibacillus enclensis]WHY70954.1 hypothetical protein QNH15_18210 [Fictibacillus enclensis]